MIPSDDTSYGDSSVWNSRFEREGDLDWGGFWIDPFVDVLGERECRKSELEGHFQTWTNLEIEHLFVSDRITGEHFKAVWRGCARK